MDWLSRHSSVPCHFGWIPSELEHQFKCITIEVVGSAGSDIRTLMCKVEFGTKPCYANDGGRVCCLTAIAVNVSSGWHLQIISKVFFFSKLWASVQNFKPFVSCMTRCACLVGRFLLIFIVYFFKNKICLRTFSYSAILRSSYEPQSRPTSPRFILQALYANITLPIPSLQPMERLHEPKNNFASFIEKPRRPKLHSASPEPIQHYLQHKNHRVLQVTSKRTLEYPRRFFLQVMNPSYVTQNHSTNTITTL